MTTSIDDLAPQDEFKSGAETMRLTDDGLVMHFTGMLTQTVRKKASPYEVPFESIETIDYTPSTNWKPGFITWQLVGDDNPQPKPEYNVNAFIIQNSARGPKAEVLQAEWLGLANRLVAQVAEARDVDPSLVMSPRFGRTATAAEVASDKLVVKTTKVEAKAVVVEEKKAEKARIAALTGASQFTFFEMFGTLHVFSNEVWKGKPHGPGSVGGSLAGAIAEVSTEGHLQQRLTLTRMFLLGPIALAAPKQTGNQKFVLHISGEDYDIQYIPSGKTPSYNQLAKVAQFINNQSRKLKPMLTEEPSVAPTVLVSSTPRKAEATLAEQLRQLAALRDDGILTEDEFTAKKTQLLGL